MDWTDKDFKVIAKDGREEKRKSCGSYFIIVKLG
jgi:hypothetical protein